MTLVSSGTASAAFSHPAPSGERFSLSVLVDFWDDALAGVYAPGNVDALMAALRKMGARRVYWMHYGDQRDEGPWREDGIPENKNLVATVRLLKQPIRVAAKAAKRHGLEIYAVYKPYEGGVSMIYPEGSPEAKRHGVLPHLGSSLPVLMRFVREHPRMRIRRRTDDLPAGLARIPVRSIQLFSRSDAPTRITQKNLQIWTSAANYRYKRKETDFSFSDAVAPAPHDFVDLHGKILARKGTPVRVLTLSALDLTEPYILITTDFEEPPGDFELSAVDMLKAFAADGRGLPISVGAGGAVEGRSSVWSAQQIDFRNWGIELDNGFGRSVVKLDAPNRSGKLGWVAFARGRNEYLPAALCECYPEVQRYWLGHVRQCLAAGVDGIDFRIENHCTHTDDPFSYGFNEIVLDRHHRRHGASRPGGEVDLKLLSRIRGEQFTGFLRRAKSLIGGAGKKMQVHLNVEFLRPDPRPSRYFAYPWNINFEWRNWIREGLLDGATLRTFQFTPEFVLADPFSAEVLRECAGRSIPVDYTRYTFFPPRTPGDFAGDLQRVYEDGRFRSLIVYETADFITPDGSGGVVAKGGMLEAIRDKAGDLGIL
jgi:hypothetical protein